MSFWHNKIITVFGGAGFIGRHLVRRLARLGARVVVPTRDLEHVLPLKPNGDVGQIIGLKGSIDDEAFLREAVKDSDAVINLIGILYETRRRTFKQAHAEFPAHLGRIVSGNPAARLIHVSAIGADVHAKAKYAASKGWGEQGLFNAMPSATILRPSIVVGSEDNFFNRFAGLALISPVLPLIGGGQTKFQPVYVGDLADAIVAVLSHEETKGKWYEIGGPTVYSFKQLLQMMLRETGRQRFFVNLPWGLAKLKASFLQLLPNPLLTVDQVEMLKTDNVAQAGALTIRDLGITPTAIETILPTYLARYRAGGGIVR